MHNEAALSACLGVERLGGRQLEGQQFVRHGVNEREAIVVEHQSGSGVRGGAILAVASHGATDLGQLGTDLILAAREEVDIEQRMVTVALHDGIAGDGQFRLLGDVVATNDANTVTAVLQQVVAEVGILLVLTAHILLGIVGAVVGSIVCFLIIRGIENLIYSGVNKASSAITRKLDEAHKNK